MASARDPRVTAYIASAAPFARPILQELRSRLHAVVPGISETIKWSVPFFQYGGKPFFGMAAFKAHCRFGFWQSKLREERSAMAGMGGTSVASVEELPTKAAFAKMAKEAMRLVDEGVKAPPKPKAERVEFPVPEDLAKALAKNKAAKATFEAFSYSARKEYILWITEAKREETRQSRLAQAIEWMAEGKKRNWKYENC